MMYIIEERLSEIPDFPGYYVSDQGNIFSFLGQGCRRKSENYTPAIGFKLKPRKTKNGYYRIYMRSASTGKRKDEYIHRLVANAFVPNPNNLPEVNHIIPDPGNNIYTNLEWVTHKENMEYAMKYGFQTRNALGQFAHK